MVSFYFHFLTVAFLFLFVVDLIYRFGQRRHIILRNFGIIGQGRYLLESVGPELRQYLFANDYEELPFNRSERSEVYRKAQNIDSASSFGTLLQYDAREIKLRHSMYPVSREELKPYALRLGARDGCHEFVLTRPLMISAMSYGALGEHAVRTLARGAKMAGIVMNTGEGGYPKYHLMEGCDLIFQLGTAKFGVRHDDGSLKDTALAELAAEDAIKMIEIKLSQGAKPGKGGLLPKEKITPEISELRGVPMGRDVVSPPHHKECVDAASTVAFIRHVQEVSGVPVGIKMCMGSLDEFRELLVSMKAQQIFPDYISIDGGEGGTGASPKSFMDGFGMPLLPALAGADRILKSEGIRDRMKLFAAGKLINPHRQMVAMAVGADAIYSARGFMLAMGCIQSLQCGNNTCPVGITTHDKVLQRGLVVEARCQRVKNYVELTIHDLEQELIAVGCRSYGELSRRHLFVPHDSILAEEFKVEKSA